MENGQCSKQGDSPSPKDRLRLMRVVVGQMDAALIDALNVVIYPMPVAQGTQLAKLFDLARQLPDDAPIWSQINDIISHFKTVEVTPPAETDPAEPEIAKETHKAEFDEKLKDVPQHRRLYKLSINTVNTCNMACKYCYANKGVYGADKHYLMSTPDLEATMTRFGEMFRAVESIQFMGGEPSMNPEAIEKTAELCKGLCDSGKWLTMPRMALVTNGQKFSKRFLEVVKKHNVSLTFSIDGPREIHDAVRVDRQGKGTYDAIRENFKQVREMGIRTDFEATFTKVHLTQGMHVIDLCQWFYDEFRQKILHCPCMSQNQYANNDLELSVEEQIQEYCAATVWGLDNMVNGRLLMPSFTHRLYEKFRKKERSYHVCPVGHGQLSVASNGDVYPCWMYIDEPHLCMGSVKDNSFPSAKSVAVEQALQAFDLFTHPDCRKCWAQTLCSGCRGADFFATKSINGKVVCDYNRAMLETFALKICDVMRQVKKHPKV